MKTHPLISVIVPVYNSSEYLHKCLDSICGQTYRNLEILCVDDGSTDNSACILQDYSSKDSRIQIITQKNAGLSAARNAALEVARGEWITGVDADDYLEKDAYEYAINHMEIEDDIIVFDAIEEKLTSDLKSRFHHSKVQGVQKPSCKLMVNTEVVFWNKLWRRKLIEKYQVRFPQGLLYEDAYFWYTIAPFARQIHILPEAKYHYLLRASSIMGNTVKGSSIVFDHIRIADKILEFYEKNPLPSHMSSLGIDVMLLYYSFTESLLHPSQYDILKQKTQEIVDRHTLYPHLKSLMAFVLPKSGWRSFFVKHRKCKSSYGLGPIKLLTVNYRNGVKIWRLLGFKVRKQSI